MPLAKIAKRRHTKQTFRHNLGDPIGIPQDLWYTDLTNRNKHAHIARQVRLSVAPPMDRVDTPGLTPEYNARESESQRRYVGPSRGARRTHRQKTKSTKCDIPNKKHAKDTVLPRKNNMFYFSFDTIPKISYMGRGRVAVVFGRHH